MAVIAVQDTPDADVTFAAASAGGDTVAPGTEAAGWNTGQVVLLVNNASAGTLTVTVDGVALPVLAGDIAAIPVNGRGAPASPVAVTYSGVASLTVAAIRV